MVKNVSTPSDAPAEASELGARITAALRQAGREALMRHKREGRPIVIWQDGKVVHVPADEIVIPPAETTDAG